LSLASRAVRPLKLLFPRNRRPFSVHGGLYGGIRLLLDLRCELQVYAGLYERETFAPILKLIGGCCSVVDIGAGRGELSIRLMREPTIQKVCAVEPSEVDIAIFRENLRLNGRENDARLTVYSLFAGSNPGSGYITLDELCATLPPPIFIKIDIEGAEIAVLKGGQRTLASRNCRFIIETHSIDAERACLAQLAQHGYQTEIISPAWWRRIIPEYRHNLPHNRWLSARPPYA
jgi:predicted RNA methylase